jgi:hypothetical protein
MTGENAYKILLDMGPKLDKDLVREFRFASGLNVTPTSRAAESRELSSVASR